MWTAHCRSAFERLKALLQSSPVLAAPEFSRPFKLAVWMQVTLLPVQSCYKQIKTESTTLSLIFYVSSTSTNKTTPPSKKNVLNFDVYVSSTGAPLEVFTDHNPLVVIHRMKDKNERLLRCSLILSEHNMNIQHIKERDNLIADCLSRP